MTERKCGSPVEEGKLSKKPGGSMAAASIQKPFEKDSSGKAM